MSLQKIPHDSTKYRINPVELINISNRLKIGYIPNEINIISSGMSSNNAPSPLVASAETAQSGHEAFYAFDKNNSTYYDSSASLTTGWIKIDLGTVTTIYKYGVNGFSNFSYAPKNWTLQGSDDDDNWTVIDTQSNQSPTTMTYFILSGSVSYRYYKLVITANNGTPPLVISEIALLNDISIKYNYIGA